MARRWPRARFDVALNRRLRGGRYEIAPLLSRIQNIGALDGVHSPDPEWHQRHHATAVWAGALADLAPGDFWEEPPLDAVSRPTLDVYWDRARALVGERRFAAARPVLDELVAAVAGPEPPPGPAPDDRRFAAAVYALLGSCHLSLGQHTEGRRCFEQGARLDPERIEYRMGEAVTARLAGPR